MESHKIHVPNHQPGHHCKGADLSQRDSAGPRWARPNVIPTPGDNSPIEEIDRETGSKNQEPCFQCFASKDEICQDCWWRITWKSSKTSSDVKAWF